MMSKVDNIKEAIRLIDIKSRKLAHRRGELEEKLRRLQAKEVARPMRRSNDMSDGRTGSVLHAVLDEAATKGMYYQSVTKDAPAPGDPFYNSDRIIPGDDWLYDEGPATEADGMPTRPRRTRS